MNKKLTCGVIGGMGPMATADFMVKVIENTKADSDAEHMHMIIDSNTSIPDRSAFILNNTESPENEILRTAKRLEKAGADFLVMTCNTAHYFADSICDNVGIPFVNMISETGKAMKKLGIKKAGLLATTGTAVSGNYEKYTEEHGIEILLPDEEYQAKVMSCIYDEIKPAGADLESCNIGPLLEVIEHLRNKGAQAVILGCTELPLVLNQENAGMKCFDPTTILAQAAVVFAGYELK